MTRKVWKSSTVKLGTTHYFETQCSCGLAEAQEKREMDWWLWASLWDAVHMGRFDEPKALRKKLQSVHRHFKYPVNCCAQSSTVHAAGVKKKQYVFETHRTKQRFQWLFSATEMPQVCRWSLFYTVNDAWQSPAPALTWCIYIKTWRGLSFTNKLIICYKKQKTINIEMGFLAPEIIFQLKLKNKQKFISNKTDPFFVPA